MVPDHHNHRMSESSFVYENRGVRVVRLWSAVVGTLCANQSPFYLREYSGRNRRPLKTTTPWVSWVVEEEFPEDKAGECKGTKSTTIAKKCTISTMMSNVLSFWMMTFADRNSSSLSAETRSMNCLYFPRSVYALAGPRSRLDNLVLQQLVRKDRKVPHHLFLKVRFEVARSLKGGPTELCKYNLKATLTMSLASAQKPSSGLLPGLRGTFTSASW